MKACNNPYGVLNSGGKKEQERRLIPKIVATGARTPLGPIVRLGTPFCLFLTTNIAEILQNPWLDRGSITSISCLIVEYIFD